MKNYCAARQMEIYGSVCRPLTRPPAGRGVYNLVARTYFTTGGRKSRDVVSLATQLFLDKTDKVDHPVNRTYSWNLSLDASSSYALQPADLCIRAGGEGPSVRSMYPGAVGAVKRVKGSSGHFRRALIARDATTAAAYALETVQVHPLGLACIAV
ncbi:hypothetical protein QTP88_016456 [Uroleucon formosanum]